MTIEIIARIVCIVYMLILNRETERPRVRESDCGGNMEPVSVWVKNKGEWAIIHRCKMCGALCSNRIAADDNPMKLMSIAMKPIGNPSFPLERIEEMTMLMGGEGYLK